MLNKTFVYLEGIIDINRYAFRGCASLETVSLPSTMRTIGNSVFSDCYSLKNINKEVIYLYLYMYCMRNKKIKKL